MENKLQQSCKACVYFPIMWLKVLHNDIIIYLRHNMCLSSRKQLANRWKLFITLDTTKVYYNLSANFSEFVLHIAKVTRHELICCELRDPKCMNLVSG